MTSCIKDNTEQNFFLFVSYYVPPCIILCENYYFTLTEYTPCVKCGHQVSTFSKNVHILHMVCTGWVYCWYELWSSNYLIIYILQVAWVIWFLGLSWGPSWLSYLGPFHERENEFPGIDLASISVTFSLSTTWYIFYLKKKKKKSCSIFDANLQERSVIFNTAHLQWLVM